MTITSGFQITIGENVFNALDPEIKEKFTEIKQNTLDWKYTDSSQKCYWLATTFKRANIANSILLLSLKLSPFYQIPKTKGTKMLVNIVTITIDMKSSGSPALAIFPAVTKPLE